MTSTYALFLALFLPLGTMPLIASLSAFPRARDIVHVLTAAVTFALVLRILSGFLSGDIAHFYLFEIMSGLPLAFNVEPLGLVFATLASGLWIVIAIYAAGYMREANEGHQTRFALFFTLAIASAIGIAFAANLFTLFIFYEALTLSTYPLVAHKGTDEARKGARTYLVILLSTSVAFLFPALIWTWLAAGTLNFEAGGILAHHLDPALAPVLLALFAFGIGKAALMPFHRWLPAAMVAPAPVSALLHAVAVVKGGVFALLKVSVYIFGTGYLSTTGASQWLIWIAAFSIIVPALIAITKDDLKARLAYSTISQLAYVTLGIALASQSGMIGSTLQIIMHAMAKITLFMCAGVIYVTAHKTKVSEMSGLGRAMPVTFTAFLIASFSIIGLPPLGGAWSKYFLLLAAADAHQTAMIIVLAVGSLLSVAYLLPVAARALFLPAPATALREAPPLMLIPVCATALGCLVLFFFANEIYNFLLNVPLLAPEGNL